MTITNNLNGQVALITGGSSGIGAGVAKSFLKHGARVIVNFLHEQERAKVISLIKEAGGIGEGYRADVSEEAEVNKMINHVIKSYGRLDILVNNAGIVHSAPVESIQTDHWVETFNVHVNGTFFCTRASLPHMYNQNYGRIINTSSQLAYKGAAGFSNYSAAKGAIISFTRSLALEIGERNICVNTVAPGATKTPILNEVPVDILENIRMGIPRKVLAEVDDIVGTYLFLASDAASHYRGQCLSPNGGDVFL
tara:strand:+ start:38 stop:793 length:756 start_codon:yes stop_codon:yes gene_type:complete